MRKVIVSLMKLFFQQKELLIVFSLKKKKNLLKNLQYSNLTKTGMMKEKFHGTLAYYYMENLDVVKQVL